MYRTGVEYTYSYLIYGRIDFAISRAGLYHLSADEGTTYIRWSVATYTRDGIRMWSNHYNILIEWCSGGNLWDGVSPCGVFCFNGDHWLYTTHWFIATISDAIYLNANVTTIHEWLAYGSISYIGIAGLMLFSADRLVSLTESFAT